MVDYKQGEVLLAWLVFSDGQGTKRRPVLVIGDFGDNDLLVVPITSHQSRQKTDIIVGAWKNAGLKLPSTVRVEKLATVSKSCIERKLGVFSDPDLARVKDVLQIVFNQIIAEKF